MTPITVSVLAALLGWESMKVEDGQFTREYSRLYTALVLTIAMLLVIAIGSFLVRFLTALKD
jgi:uncharacterized membrane protein